MKIFFKTRQTARVLASKTSRKVSDQGKTAPIGKRWAISFK